MLLPRPSHRNLLCHLPRNLPCNLPLSAASGTHLRDFQTPHAAGCGTGPVPTAVARKAAAAGRARQYLEARRTVESSGEGRGGSASQDSSGQATIKEEL